MRPETRDLNLRAVLIFAIGLSVFLVGAHAVVGRLLQDLGARSARLDAPASPLRDRNALPPPPRLQQNPGLDLETLRRREERELGTSGWVERSRGTVRIPVERAMELLLRRGLPAREASE